MYIKHHTPWTTTVCPSPRHFDSPLIPSLTPSPLTAQASQSSTRTRAIFVLAASKPPYAVYGNPFYEHAGSGNIFSISSSGSLKENIQNYPYSPNSAIHGMVFDPSETYLYSADMWGNKVWTHKKASDGTLTLVGSIDAPKPGDHPRWVAMHPSGQYLYALMEAGNTLAVYVIDPSTGLPVYTHLSYPLIPSGLPPAHLPPKGKMYRSDVCFLTSSGSHLFATARSNDHSIPGYISAFRLGKQGNIEKQLFCQPTPTSGGHSNAVAPCEWSDEWMALCDDQEGWVEMYRWKDEMLARVARCDIKEPGAAMNAIWYD